MSDYIEMPIWIRNLDFINESTLITEFVQAYAINDIKKIDMDIIRSYYRQDKEKFINLIDELALRGFTFHTDRPNNMLPMKVYELDNTCIFVKKSTQYYKNINFSKLGLANFIERFNVMSDYFFQYIKLDNFLHINSGISLEILKQEFLSCGFNFANKEELALGTFDHIALENAASRENSQEENNHEEDSSASDVKIDDVFYENGFKMFRKFCWKNDLIYMGQLKDFSFEGLKAVTGFGQYKINNIEERYKNYANSSFTDFQKVAASKDFSSIDIHNSYIDVEIKGLKAIDIDEALIDEFKKKNIETIGDILKGEFSELTQIKGIGKTKINRFITNIKLLKQPPEELMQYVMDNIKKNDNFNIFRARSIGKATLQQLGEQYNITRERIRQKEKNIFHLFESFFLLFKTEIFGRGEKTIIDMDDIKNIFPDDEDMLHVKYALISETYPPVVYFKELDKFLIDQKLDEVKHKLDSIIDENIEDIFNYYDEMLSIDKMLKEENLEFIDLDDFIAYAEQKGFISCGNYLMKRGISSRKIYNHILKEYFPEGMKISDQRDRETVLKIAKEEFKLERHSEEDIRAISAIIGENVLCDRGKYIHPDYIHIPKALIERIKNYILEHTEDTLFWVDIFYKFEVELKEQSNVDNKHFLHGVLRYYYEEEFTFNRDKISKISTEIISTNKILENFLMEQHEPVTKEFIREQFTGWTDIMLQNAEMVNKNIISWDNGRMTCASHLEITDEDKKNLQNAIEAALSENEGYCNAKIIYKKLQLKMNSFYKKNGISSHVSLFYVLEYLFEDIYYFRIPHILREKQSKQFSTQDIIMKIIEDRKVVTYEEISDYLKNKLKMNESTMYAARQKVVSKLLEVRKGEYALKDSIQMSEETLNKIREFIENRLSEKVYVPMLSIIDYSSLPDIGYDWNPYLLQDIIEEYIEEYRFIEKAFKDRRYRCSSIVRKDCNLSSIIDLIIYVLKNEYKDKENMTVQAIQDYLALRNIILNSLPYEFLESERVRIDEFHRVDID